MRTGLLVSALAGLIAASILAARVHGHDHDTSGAEPASPHSAEPGVRGEDVGVATLPRRQAAQLEAARAWKVRHDFRFSDRQPESGITFEHSPVEDAGKRYKAVHYDHGNGVAVADVDGDGRPDVYFVDQIGRSELWRNLGGGRFEDVTDAAGVGMAGRIGVGASFADVDGDGDQDLFVTTVRKGNALFENDGRGRFRDVTQAAGLAYSGHSSGAVWFDFDRDGRLDLFLVNVGRYTSDQLGTGGYFIGLPDAFEGHLHPERSERSILYRNLGGGRFADVSAEAGLLDGSWSGDGTFVDFDEDLYPELYLVNMQGNDHYWVNVGGQRFEDRTAAHFPKTSWGAMGIKSFDHDLDGRPDLLITDMHSDMAEDVDPFEEKQKSVIPFPNPMMREDGRSIYGNSLFRNLGGGRFEEASDRLGLENYWPWGVSVGDLNADGWEDVLITASMNYPFRYAINSLLLNGQGGRFLDAEFVLGVEPRRDGRTHKDWFRLDCDGADRGHQNCAGRSGEVVVQSALGTRSSAIFDLDADGDLDIVTNEFGDRPQVLVSDLAQRHPDVRWLSLRLRGTRSNRDGLGAWVTVSAAGRTHRRFHDGKSGYLSQSAMPLYFGLGAARRVDSVEVLWPSGHRQVVRAGIPVAGELVITEDPETGPGATDG